jgi:hypothetical protein
MSRPSISRPEAGTASSDRATEFGTLGMTALGPVLTDDQLERVRGGIDEALPQHGVRGGYAQIIHDAWRVIPAAGDLISQLGRIACQALDMPELVLFHDHVLVKHPMGEDMEWHQDFSYLPLDRAAGMTLWVALDDVSVDNGCLYYLFGSHLLGERRAAWGLTGSDDPRASLPALEIDPDEPGIPAPTVAGCAVAHDTFTCHRSPRNTSGRPRRSWALSFVVPQARWAPRHSPHPRSAVAPREEGQELEPDLPRVRST